ncbi:MAG: ABC transporter substrate-binding protein [Dehalococcoidales bacterium]
MKRGVIWIVLTVLMVTSLVLASCSSSTTTSAANTTTTASAVITTTTTTNVSPATTTTSTAAVTTAVTTTSTGNWWDSLGTPQYGGTLTDYSNQDFGLWDPYNSSSLATCISAYMEGLYGDDWALSPSIFDFSTGFRPTDYVTGLLALSWEFTTPGTYIVHLRQNVYWQNIPPLNGRQFVANDVVYNFGRDFGHGDGFTTPSPALATNPLTSSITSVTATDNYTVVFQFNTPNVEFILESMEAVGEDPIAAPDAVTQWGNLNDWHHAIGTGPFILTDYVGGSSVTFVKNPNYWGYDERYPQNQLPYVSTVKILVIPDLATGLAAVRTGKIDVMENIGLQNAQAMQKTSPSVVQLTMPGTQGGTVDPRVDKAPYTKINVRIALQEAIDLQSIATNYYGGTCSPNPQSLTSSDLKGWGFPYEQWPASLQAQYAYNPTNAKALLAAAGYPNGFNTDCVADSSGDINLLQIVQSDFAAINVNMSIQLMDPTTWTNYVRTQHLQDALAFRSSGSLGMSYQPFRQFIRYQTGYVANYEMVADPTFDAFYPAALAATTIDQVKAILQQANEYLSQQQWVISLLNPSSFNVYQPWLKGYAGQSFAMTGGSSGPMMFGYYGSRFWIDQSLK